MRKTLIILFVIQWIFPQDEYPYFSDITKQLEFEKNKIYVKEIDEREIQIHNAPVFNYAYLFNGNQPMVLPGIKSDYKYIYKFEIIFKCQFTDYNYMFLNLQNKKASIKEASNLKLR